VDFLVWGLSSNTPWKFTNKVFFFSNLHLNFSIRFPRPLTSMHSQKLICLMLVVILPYLHTFIEIVLHNWIKAIGSNCWINNYSKMHIIMLEAINQSSPKIESLTRNNKPPKCIINRILFKKYILSKSEICEYKLSQGCFKNNWQ
jgi:hypothetical protein